MPGRFFAARKQGGKDMKEMRASHVREPTIEQGRFPALRGERNAGRQGRVPPMATVKKRAGIRHIKEKW